jgi:ABC-type nitrate/sulfonate/bicarbonate transport system substrate-binding protein
LQRRRFLAGVAGLVSLGSTPWLLSGCGGAVEHDSEGLPVIRWGFFRNYQPVYVGVERGFFREVGVDVQLTGTFNSGPAVVQAAGTGDVDAGHSALTGIAGAVAAGIEIVGIGDSQTEFADAPLQQWFVRQDSDLQSLDDLRGVRIGTNSLAGSFYYTALIALERVGIRRDEVEFVVLPHELQGQSLLNDQIDVAGIIDPHSVILSANPGVRRLFTGADVLGERQFSLIWVTRELAESNPEAVSRFLDGYRRTITWMAENPDEASTTMASVLGLAESQVVPHRYTDNAEVRPDDVQFWIDLMIEHGDLDDPNLTAADLLLEAP